MTRRLILVATVLLALLTASCTGSEQSTNLVEVEPLPTAATNTAAPVAGTGQGDASITPPGIIYTSSTTGDLVAYTPSSMTAEVIWTANTEFNATTIGPTNQGTQLDVMMLYPATVETALFELQGTDVVEVANDFITQLSPCLDRSTAAATSVAHNVVERTTNGFLFSAVEFTADGQVSSSDLLTTERVSTVCPQWSTARDVVATSSFPIEGDRVTISSVVERGAESFEVRVDGCQITPSSFSPDGSQLALAVICFDEAWASSGLYLAEMASMRDGLTVDDLTVDELTKIADGNSNGSSWHPSGGWLVVQGIESVENQPAPGPRSDTPTAQIINLSTGVATPVAIDGVAANHVVWLANPVR